MSTLSKEEVLRYSRHLIMPEVGMEGQLKLKDAKVLLVGTGGLGQLFIEASQIDNPIETWAGVVLTVLLALVLDVIIVVGARLAAPWTRAGR